MRRVMTICFALTIFSGCQNTDDKQRIKTELLVSEADRQVGMPNVIHFSERKLLKRIYEMRDQENLVMYAYIVSLDGDLNFLCKCMGYGVPYGTQFTNPHRPSQGGPIDQPEPNGLFMPATAEGTWLLMIAADGKTHPLYCEPRVIVSPLKMPTAKGNPAD